MKHFSILRSLVGVGGMLTALAFPAAAAFAQLTVTSVSAPLGGSAVVVPEGSSVDVYGNVYVAITPTGLTTNNIIEIPANGGAIVTLATGLSATRGVTADSLGNVYVDPVADTTILKIPAGGGSTTTVGSGFERPWRMTVDSADNLYVADSDNNRVVKITPSGTQTVLGFTGLDVPKDITIDGQGNFFVANSAGNSIIELSATGVQSTVISGLSTPVSVAVDSSEDFFVVDTTGLKEFTAASNYATSTIIYALGSAGEGVNLSPHGDLVASNNVKVYDIVLGAGSFYDYGTPIGSAAGTVTYTFTSSAAETFGTTLFQSNNSATVAYKDAGSDSCASGKSVVAAGTCTLNVAFSPAQAGLVPGSFNLVNNKTPAGILSTTYINGVGTGPLPAFNPGTQNTLLSSLGTPTGMAVDLGGNVYVADATDDTVTEIGSTTAALAFTGLTRPTGIAVDGAGSVYVSDSANDAVYKLTSAGVQSPVPTTGLSAPKGLAFDRYSNLYIADSGNQRIVRIDSLGNQTTVAFTGLASPAFVAVDLSGNIYVSDTGQVYELPFAGTQKTLRPAGLSAAAGIAAGADGSLYIADSGNADILVMPPSGTPFTLASGLSLPLGIALASNGSLYIANSRAANVLLLDRTNETLTFPSTATGASSAAMTASVQNVGNAALSASAFSVSSGFAQVTPLAATDCNASSTVEPSAECNANVIFSPTSLGAASGSATLTDNALNATAATQSITLVGTGIVPTTTSVLQTTPSTGNPVYGQTVTVTASVIPSTGSGTPTGTVSFSLDGGAASAGIGMTGGQAVFTLPALSAGPHTVVASYSGDASNAASSSTSFTVTVTPAVLTVTAASQTRMYNVANAALTYSITGFVYADTSAVVSGTPSFSTTATTTSAPGSYPVTISAGSLSAANYTFSFVAGSIVVTQATSTITFPAMAGVTYGVSPIPLAATANSGLAITYSVVSGNATVTNGAGAAVTITGAGSVTLAANQAGNSDYAAASQVTQTFAVSPAILTASANNLSKQTGQANPPLTYTLSGFVNGDTAAVVSGTPTLSTTATTSSPSGTYPITIVQGSLSAANYTFTFVPATLTVTGSTPQTITFGTLPNIVYGNGPVPLSATASSGAAVSYAVTGPAVLNVNNTLSIIGQGTVSVTASQAGNSTYAAATSVTQTFTVAPATLIVTLASFSRTINTPNPTFTYAITGFVNGDTIAVVSGAPAISTTATTSSPTGTYPISATQGTLLATNYIFSFQPGTLTVNSASQTITFGALSTVTYGTAPIALNATASSNLPVTYTVAGPATLSGSALVITGAGSVSVTAAQAGNATYAAATSVTQSFTVAPAPLTVTASNVNIAFGAAIPTTFTYTITGFVNADTRSVVSGAPTITTTATTTSPGGTYPITPTAGTLAAVNYIFANFVPGTLTITADTQTITFPALPNIPQTTGSITLNATASSGLPITYTETGTAAVSISGNVLTISGPGTVSITASQPGDSSYVAAAPVTQSFTITATTTTVLTLSANTINVGSSVTLTAKITFTKAGTPTGTVSFYDGTTLLTPSDASLPSAVPITASGLTATATLATTVVPSGSSYITAVYSGDSNYTGSSTGATADAILVVAPDFNVSASPSILSVSAGQSATSTITVTPVGGYSSTVTFSCPSAPILPSFLTCSFTPAAMNFYPGTGTSTVAQSTTLSIAAASNLAQASLPSPRNGPANAVRLAGILLGLPSLLLLGLVRRRSLLVYSLSLLLLMLALSSGLLALSGCGGGIGTSAAGGTYNIPVTLSDGSTVSHVVTITVNVQ